jgi:hypothetical protein
VRALDRNDWGGSTLGRRTGYPGAIYPSDAGAHGGPEKAQEGPMTVLIYVDTSKQVGDPDHLKVFANADAAETWFEENDPEGVAFEYEVLE